MEENQISIKIGERPPEPFTAEEVQKLVMIAEKWREFCQNQEKTEEEKKMGWNACNRCPLKGTFCCDFQEFSDMRKEKINGQIKALETAKEQNAKDLLRLTRLLGFVEGKTTSPF